MEIEARLLEESPSSSAHQFPKSREVWAGSVREADPASRRGEGGGALRDEGDASSCSS